MVDNTQIKLERAAKDIAELSELLRKNHPFRYIFETNQKTGECSTYAERDEAIIGEIADISYGVIQRLRTALDYAYWEIVSPFAADAKPNVQFPFSKTENRLVEAVKNRLANRVSDPFFQAIIALKPHGEPGGNELLYAIHDLAAEDRHRFPTPIGEYKRISSDIIRRQVPNFPAGIINCGFGQNGRDVGWRIKPLPFLEREIVLKRELDVPIDIVIQIGAAKNMRQMVPTLNAMIDKTKETIQIIRSA